VDSGEEKEKEKGRACDAMGGADRIDELDIGGGKNEEGKGGLEVEFRNRKEVEGGETTVV